MAAENEHEAEEMTRMIERLNEKCATPREGIPPFIYTTDDSRSVAELAAAQQRIAEADVERYMVHLGPLAQPLHDAREKQQVSARQVLRLEAILGMLDERPEIILDHEDCKQLAILFMEMGERLMKRAQELR